uniref:protein-tyrosine-phosphatase n=1 Tax=Neobodo designis TaxID=312471 RepID=A0A7S1PW03_NEODS|mmetsp:Transcript_20551/g.63930  ORF Transcript_20551/g.63930 Transcript_20551/m.63930 type:complete len:225 (+) Transcript_20551:39-713(+)
MASFNFGSGGEGAPKFDFGNIPINSAEAGGDGDSDDEALADRGPSAIIPDRLYIGNRFDAVESALRKRGFTHVLCCTSGALRVPMEGITRVLMPLCDYGTSDIMEDVVDVAVPFIADALADADSRVLVHCSQGVNRSVMTTVTYLMVKERMPLREAWALVSSKRTQACMHDNYVDQLRKLDLHLFGTASTEPGDLPTTRAAIAFAMADYRPPQGAAAGDQQGSS